MSLIGETSYRCLYLKNTNVTDTAADVRIWLKQDTPGGDYLQFGLDPAGKGNGSTTGVATTIADEYGVPAGVTFAAPTTWATGLQVGSLLPGQVQALWIKRVVPVETRGTVISNSGVIAFSATV